MRRLTTSIINYNILHNQQFATPDPRRQAQGHPAEQGIAQLGARAPLAISTSQVRPIQAARTALTALAVMEALAARKATKGLKSRSQNINIRRQILFNSKYEIPPWKEGLSTPGHTPEHSPQIRRPRYHPVIQDRLRTKALRRRCLPQPATGYPNRLLLPRQFP